MDRTHGFGHANTSVANSQRLSLLIRYDVDTEVFA